MSYFTLHVYTTLKNSPIILHSKEIRYMYSLKKLKNRLKMLMIIECELMLGPYVNQVWQSWINSSYLTHTAHSGGNFLCFIIKTEAGSILSLECQTNIYFPKSQNYHPLACPISMPSVKNFPKTRTDKTLLSYHFFTPQNFVICIIFLSL